MTKDAPSTSPDLTCLLVDDHPAILRATASFLRGAGITIVGTARSGAEALATLERQRPTAALVDVRLPDFSGLEVARRAAREVPETCVILYAAELAWPVVREALDIGVRGMVLKEAPLVDLPRALSLVVAGRLYLDPKITGALAAEPSPELSGREREILRLLTQGLTDHEIGSRLYLSSETIRAHIQKAIHRLGARSRVHAVATALRGQVIR